MSILGGMDMDCSDLDDAINGLCRQIPGDPGERADWKSIWAEIRAISAGFSSVRFPDHKDRDKAWDRFQSAVERVKRAQEAHNREREKRKSFFENSDYHLGQIRKLADRAERESGLGNLVLFLATGGLSAVIEQGLDALFQELDAEKEKLQHRSQKLKAAREYFAEYKDRMLGKHKHAAFEHIQSIQDRLNDDWAAWKQGKDDAHAERRRQYEERQARREERARKRAEWLEGQRQYIEMMEEKLDRWQATLEKHESNLDTLRDKLMEARSDSFRERVEGWVAECEANIDRYESMIRNGREKRDGAIERLRDAERS